MPLDRNAYQAIELAVKATGQQGVNDLGQAAQKAANDFQAFQLQLQAGAPVNAQSVSELARLKAQVETTAEAYKAAMRVVAGKSAEGGIAVGALARSFQEVGRGVQDASLGGFLGVVNNLSPATSSLAQAMKFTAPQVAAVGAATDLLASAAFTLYTNWGTVRKFFDDGLGPRIIPDVKELKAELEALTSKEYKTTVDVFQIQILTDKIREATKARAAFDALDAPSKAQKERADRFAEAVKEGGGRKAVVDSVLAAEGAPAETPGVKAIREQIAETVQEMSKQTDDALYQALAAKKKSLEDSIPGQQSADMQNRQKAVEDRVAQAALGDQKSIDYIDGLLKAKPNKAAANGVDLDAFGKHLGQTDKEKAAAEREVEQAISESAQETERRVRDAVRSVKAGLDDALQKGIFDALKAGETRDSALAKARPALIAALRKRGVGGFDISATADELLDQAGDSAENLINEGATPKLDVKAKRDRDQAVNQVVNRVQGGYAPEAERQLYNAIRAGGDPAAAVRSQHGPLAKAIGGRGDVPAELVDAVAAQILDRAKAKALSDYDSGQKPAIVGKEQRDAEAAAKKSGFLPELEARIAANRRAIQAGAPVARNNRDVHNFETTGTPYVLPEPELRRRLGNEVGQNLRRSGGDPRQAAGIVAVAAGHVDQTYQRDMAQLGDGVRAMQGVVNATQNQIGHAQGQLQGILNGVSQLQKKSDRLAQNAMRLNMQANKSQQRRPSLLTEADMW